MKTIKIFQLATILLSMLLYSCEDKFLERGPDDKVNEQTAFSKWDMVNSMANRLYRDLRTRDRGIVMLNHFSLSGITDECKGTKVEAAIPDIFNFGSFGPSIGMPSGANGIYWGDQYASIRGCNVFLRGVDEYKSPTNPIVGQEGDLKMRKAEVHFLRAYYHFLLARFYGNIKYMDYAAELTGNLAFEQDPWPVVLEKMLADIQYAVDSLPALHNNLDFGRVDKGTALALKAIVLYMNASPMYNGGIIPGNDDRIGRDQYSTYNKEKWKLAADAAKALMDLKISDTSNILRYSLYAGNGNSWQAESGNKVYARIKQIYIDMNAYRNEWIFTLTRNKDQAWQGDHIPPSFGGASRLQPLQEQVDEYEFIGNDGYGYAIYDPVAASKGYNDKNPYINRDPRFYSDVMYHGSMYQTKVINTATGADKIGASNATSTGYYLRKFYHEDWKRTGSWSLHFPMIRLPEIQLIYCEAMNKYYGASASSEIYTILNALRARSFMAPVPPGLSPDALLKYIQRERRVELFYENKRYFYSRWNLEPTSASELAKESVFDDANPVLPYPRTQHDVHGMIPVVDPAGLITISGVKYSMQRFRLETRVFTDKNYFWPIMQTELVNCPTLIQSPNW